jgi:hypothetical protein
MSAVKAISTWIAPTRLPSVQGYLIAVGGLGAASATCRCAWRCSTPTGAACSPCSARWWLAPR